MVWVDTFYLGTCVLQSSLFLVPYFESILMRWRNPWDTDRQSLDQSLHTVVALRSLARLSWA